MAVFEADSEVNAKYFCANYFNFKMYFVAKPYDSYPPRRNFVYVSFSNTTYHSRKMQLAVARLIRYIEVNYYHS